jgi:hypothetical protein
VKVKVKSFFQVFKFFQVFFKCGIVSLDFDSTVERNIIHETLDNSIGTKMLPEGTFYFLLLLILQFD